MEDKFILDEELVYGDTETFVSLLKKELGKVYNETPNERLLNIIEELNKVNY